MSKTIDFLKPRLRGERFEGAAIPLEVLKDLAVLEEMVIEVAKWCFLEDHHERHRVPNGFTEDIALKLTAVEDGSAIPVISLVLTTACLPFLPPTNQEYFEKAREAIVSAVGAAERNRGISTHLPDKCLAYFDRLGRSLRGDEAIEFSTTAHPAVVRLDRETRRRLLEASNVRELTEEVKLRGAVSAADQDGMTFHLQLVDGRKVTGPIPDQHLDTIIDAFKDYRRGVRVLLQGIGKFNRQQRLTGLESIEHICLLDPLDVPSRIDELRGLGDGWLEGRGVAPLDNGLTWFASTFEQHFPDELALPHVYPTPEGGIQAEWSLGSNEISIEVDLSSHQADWNWLDTGSDQSDTKELNLDAATDWTWLADAIRRFAGGES